MTEPLPENAREAIFSHQLKFGGLMNVPRERAIDEIVKRSFADVQRDTGASEEQIAAAFAGIKGRPSLRTSQIHESIERLQRDAVLDQVSPGRFALTPAARKEVVGQLSEGTQRLTRCLNRFFGRIITAKNRDSVNRYFLNVCAAFSRCWRTSMHLAPWPAFLWKTPFSLQTFSGCVTALRKNWNSTSGMQIIFEIVSAASSAIPALMQHA